MKKLHTSTILPVHGGLAAVSCLAAVALGACSRGEPVKPTARPSGVSAATGVVHTAESSGSVRVPEQVERKNAVDPAGQTEQAQSSPLAPVSSVEKPSFRVCFITSGGGSSRVGVENAEKLTAMLKEGDSCWGYQVVRIDASGKRVIFGRDGSEFEMKVEEVALSVPGAVMVDGSGFVPGKNAGQQHAPDLSDLDPPVFAPTAEETAAGIDPNNPATWPDGYRGPGIERAFKNNPAMQDSGPRLVGPND